MDSTIINIILTSFIIVLILFFYFWINPKLKALDQIIGMYKGFGEDYHKWYELHKEEYKNLETRLDKVKNQLSEMSNIFNIKETDPDKIIARAKELKETFNKTYLLINDVIKIQQDLTMATNEYIALIDIKRPFRRSMVNEWMKNKIYDDSIIIEKKEKNDKT